MSGDGFERARSCGVLARGAFQVEKAALEVLAEGKAGEGAVGADDAMAGNDHAGGVGGIGAADGASGEGRSQLRGELAVGARFTERNSAEGGPDAELEGRAGQSEREIEGAATTGKKIGELCASGGGGGGVVHQMAFGNAGKEGVGVAERGGGDRAGFGDGEAEGAEWGGERVVVKCHDGMGW